MNKLLLALILSPFVTFAQESPKDSKVAFGIFVLPEMNDLTTNNPIGTETVHAKLGFSGGLNVEYRLTQKIALRSGLGYGWKTYDHTHEGLIFNSDLNPQSGVQTTSTMESQIAYSELQLPLLFQYKFTPNVFFTLGVEVNTAFADQSKRTVYYGNGDVEQLSKITGAHMNFSPQFSIGYIVPNSTILIEPMVKYDMRKYIIAESNHFNYGVRMTYNF